MAHFTIHQPAVAGGEHLESGWTLSANRSIHRTKKTKKTKKKRNGSHHGIFGTGPTFLRVDKHVHGGKHGRSGGRSGGSSWCPNIHGILRTVAVGQQCVGSADVFFHVTDVFRLHHHRVHTISEFPMEYNGATSVKHLQQYFEQNSRDNYLLRWSLAYFKIPMALFHVGTCSFGLSPPATVTWKEWLTGNRSDHLLFQEKKKKDNSCNNNKKKSSHETCVEKNEK